MAQAPPPNQEKEEGASVRMHAPPRLRAPDFEFIDFHQPSRNDLTVMVYNIPSNITKDFMMDIFSQYGLVYDVLVPSDPNYVAPAVDDPTQASTFGPSGYGLVRYFSTYDARKAVKYLNNTTVRGLHISCRLATKQRVLQPYPLHPSKCFQLANHFLGFDAWSISILELHTHTPSSKGEHSYFCKVQLCFPNHGGATVVGCAVGSSGGQPPKDKIPKQKKGPRPSLAILSAGNHMRDAKRFATSYAQRDAFSKVAIVRASDGRVEVFVREGQEELVDDNADPDVLIGYSKYPVPVSKTEWLPKSPSHKTYFGRYEDEEKGEGEAEEGEGEGEGGGEVEMGGGGDEWMPLTQS